MMAAFEYFDGLPQAALTDRRKSVCLDMDGTTPIWKPICADGAACVGIAPRVWKPRTPHTKGKIERRVGIMKDGFWPGVRCTDIDDVKHQARAWGDRLPQNVHRPTQRVPRNRWVEEQVRPEPPDSAWERFGAEERCVRWDGFLSSDGVLSGLPVNGHLFLPAPAHY
jgi:transposase